MGKTSLIICITIMLAGSLYAQQDPLYSQYMFNTLSINPAYAGSRNVLSLTAVGRTQWVGLDGAPDTQAITLDSPVGKSKRAALGLQIFNDEIGVTGLTGFNGIYAYRLRFSEKGTLSLGLQAGLSNYRGDFSQVLLDSQGGFDPAFGEDVNKWLFNAGVGAYYNADRFYIGLSAPQLFNHTLGPGNGLVYSGVDQARQYVHAFLASGYVFDTNNPDIKLKPSFVIKYVKGSPIQADLNLNVWLYDTFSLGVSYRTDAAAVLLGELQISDQFRIGYGYDFSTNDLGNFNSGSHEILLRYEFGYRSKRIKAPRFF